MYKRIISRLDIKNGILVKGISLEVRNGGTRFFSKAYYKDCIDEMHFHNVIATLYESNMMFDIIEKNSKEIFVNVSVGGGIKNIKDVDKLLRIGADKIVINSAGVKDPTFLKKLVEVYGASTISVNIETAKIDNKYEVFIETGRERTKLDLFKWIEEVQKVGVGEVIVTDIFTEGKNKGYNINLLRLENLDCQLVALKGAGPKENILEIFQECNVDTSVASLFHYYYIKQNKYKELKGSNSFVHFFDEKDRKGMSILELKKYLKSSGVKIRL